MTWKRGAIEVRDLLESGHLELIRGTDINGSTPMLVPSGDVMTHLNSSLNFDRKE
jgi:hypothetical protein